jgi:LPS export ABC transporter permease LptF
MKTLNWYVTKNFIITFFASIGILTFGMMGGRLIKIFEFISRGVPTSAVFKFILYISPLVMANSIPFAILVSIMLVFGRMSADSEITAMRACGVSILQIIAPIMLIIFVMTCVCLYLRMDIVPYCTWRAGSFIKKVVIDEPMSILEPGRPVEFENYHIYVEAKEKNTIKNVQVFIMGEKGESVKNDINAVSGRIEVDKNSQVLKIILNNATIVAFEKGTQPSRTFSKEFSFSIDYGAKFNALRVAKDVDDLAFREIFGRATLNKKLGKDNTKVEVELNQRIALALSPIAFMLLGMPLAIRTSRRETSVGLFLSVILAGTYYALVMVCTALNKYPQYYPQVLLWIPNIIYQIFGTYSIIKIAKR